MSDDMTIRIDSEQYVLRQDGEGLQVGRRNGDDVAWLETVDLGLLPGPAREALERGIGMVYDPLAALSRAASARPRSR